MTHITINDLERVEALEHADLEEIFGGRGPALPGSADPSDPQRGSWQSILDILKPPQGEDCCE